MHQINHTPGSLARCPCTMHKPPERYPSPNNLAVRLRVPIACLPSQGVAPGKLEEGRGGRGRERERPGWALHQAQLLQGAPLVREGVFPATGTRGGECWQHHRLNHGSLESTRQEPTVQKDNSEARPMRGATWQQNPVWGCFSRLVPTVHGTGWAAEAAAWISIVSG